MLQTLYAAYAIKLFRERPLTLRGLLCRGDGWGVNHYGVALELPFLTQWNQTFGNT